MGKEYICTLDEATQKKAIDELHEVPADRMDAVRALQAWVQQQPHIHVPDYDDWEYIMILRGAKFSQLRARELIEGYLTIRSIAPQWFHNIDTHEQKLQLLLDDGYAIPLPKQTKEGCQVIIYRPGCLDEQMKRYSNTDVVRLINVVGYYTSISELTQVNGSVFIFDCTGFSAKHLSNQMSISDLKLFNKLWQKNVPGRFKMIHYYNAGRFFEGIMALTKPFLSKKFVDRIKVHDTLESLYKFVPMEILPKEYLPDDYSGPSAGSIKEITDNFKQKIQLPEFRDLFLQRTDSKWRIDESKIPTDDQSRNQSFRKLNVD